MDPEIKEYNFNKTIAPWLGKTYKLMNMYISDIIHKQHINVTKEQWIVLKTLLEEKNGIIQNDLAYITNRNKASLTRLINVMEKNDLVTRISSKEDARKKKVFITNKGQELFLKMKPLMLQSVKTIQEGISPEEIETLIKIMSKIQHNLKKQIL